MKIQYTMDFEDFTAYYEFFLSNSPFAVKWRKKLLIIFAICAFSYFSVITLFVGQPEDILYALVIEVLFLYLYLRYSSNTFLFTNYWKKYGYSHFSNEEVYSIWIRKRVLGVHELDLLEDKMQKTRSGKRRLTKYTRINHIEDIGTHVFVYDDYPVPNIIPKNKIAEGDLDAFIVALKQKL